MLVLKVVFVLLLLPEKETFLEPFVLRDLLPSSIGSYYRYIGSLTTPPCSKVVEWIVFSRPVFLSYKQTEGQVSFHREAWFGAEIMRVDAVGQGTQWLFMKAVLRQKAILSVASDLSAC
ncbi:receptor-type tyrosine- phosphatase gamma-like protein [Labeo rohita]|uniref:Receptor-type tyrosine-phosphatase gamma-like protein n=1 Tax=Labeo rohita TaxID=84645 RepID=A0A498P364_LABRO|nr:receptor-type tyrosine- phosphatase gamma-like protein [Labeo rohita]